MRIEQAVNLDDIRRLSRRRLPRIAFDFIDGGADDERGLLRNRQAFADYQLVPRYLVDVSQRDQSVTLFGKTYGSPVGICPMGLGSLFREGADSMMAQAAVSRNIPFLMSTSSNESIETVARIAPEHVWFQLYCTRDERINIGLLSRVLDAGVKTLVVTVDVPVNANRERNRRNGFTRPFRLTPSIALQALTHPAWLWQYLRSGGIPMMQNWAPYAGAGASAEEVADLFGSMTPSPSSSWKTLETLRQRWSGQLVVKGILHPADARLAVDLGVDGIIVSNHGGRQLDAAPAPLDMLAAVLAAVPATLPVMLDSGVRRGSDVLIALCLGARFTFVGRPVLHGAAAAGLAGAEKVLQILHREIDTVMAQIGCTQISGLHAGYLRRSGAQPAA